MQDASEDRNRRTRPAATAAVAAALSWARAAVGALLHRWRYRPERRYMRGGGQDAGPSGAAR
jgi:hypothetical protein